MWLGEFWVCVCLIAFHFLSFHSIHRVIHSLKQIFIQDTFMECLPHPGLSTWPRGGHWQGGRSLVTGAGSHMQETQL